MYFKFTNYNMYYIAYKLCSETMTTINKLDDDDLIEVYLTNLRRDIGALPPVDEEPLRKLFEAKDYGSLLRAIRDGMGIKQKIRLGVVSSGGPASAPGWMNFADKSTIFVRRSHLENSSFEQVAVVMAHELAHVVLFTKKHPFQNVEPAVDLTAMLLGYRDLYVRGCHTSRIKVSVDSRITEKTGLLYLQEHQVRLAALALGGSRWKYWWVRTSKTEYTAGVVARRAIAFGYLGSIACILLWALWSNPDVGQDSHLGQHQAFTPSQTSFSNSQAQTESMPPFGTDSVLNESQIRYCLAEQIRMRGFESALNRYSRTSVARFNARISDYNARCGSYRYKRSVYSRVSAEVFAREQSLFSKGVRENYADR